MTDWFRSEERHLLHAVAQHQVATCSGCGGRGEVWRGDMGQVIPNPNTGYLQSLGLQPQPCPKCAELRALLTAASRT